MAKHQFNNPFEKLLRTALQLNQRLTSQDRFWLMRSGFLAKQPQGQTQGGFILPTVTLLLLMLSLVLGILIFRTGNRTNQVITERQQRQIYNATTPAIERAKAKLEFLFTEDTIPALPSENDIVNALSNVANYDLPDETRVDLNNDGTLDNAWTFWFDADGDPTTSGLNPANDGNEVQVGYSMLSYATSPDGAVSLQDPDEDKAAALVVRNGPINLSGGAGNPNCPNPGLAPFQGWQQVTGASLRKAVQVHAFARGPNGVVSTLEMQQDKQANLGNKWGAWFRNDMEIFPGPDFNWNGAMNVAGSYIVGGNQVDLYPISSPYSCVYTPDNSEIVMGDIPQAVIDQNGDIDGNPATGVGGNDLNGGTPFRGQFVIGTLRDNNFNGGAGLFPHTNDLANLPPARQALNNGNDSVVAAVNAPGDIALDPVLLLTQAQNATRDGNSDNLNPNAQEATWNKDGGAALRWWVEEERLHNEYQPTPFVDDTYRADNRWGPKPLYSEQPYVPAPRDGSLNVADPTTNEITVASSPGYNAAEQQASFDRLTRDNPPASNTTDEESYGLDGYWERRAKAQGVRIIVGQRLELGNVNGWVTEHDADRNGVFEAAEDLNNNGLLDFDPLYPPPANAADVASSSIVVPAVDDDGNPIGANVNTTYIDTNGNGSMENRRHEQRQWKTLRTNLAAAQASTLYHYLMASGDYPTACIAAASHPGTQQTIQASTTFNAVSVLAGASPTPTDVVDVSFLTGQGTNGWEFYPPEYTTAGAVTHAGLVTAQNRFENAIDNGNSDLRVALTNLAYFAGDPAGAFPAFQDTDDNANGNDAANLAAFRNADQRDATLGPVVHPYPIQAMWGDFSNLRRVVDQLNGDAAYANTTYANLSLADQTTLQTAGCTLGILAYNVNNVLNNADVDDDFMGDRTLLNAIRRLETDGVLSRSTDSGNDYVEFDYAGNNDPEYVAQVDSPGQLFNLSNPAGSVPSDVFAEAIEPYLTADEFVTLQATRERMQIQRDRALGFSQGINYRVEFKSGRILGQQFNVGQTIRLQCDYIANDYFGKGKPNDGTAENEFLTIALTMCPSGPKYPSLAYLFPDRDRAHDGTLATPGGANALEPEQIAARLQPQSEPYTSETLEVNGVDYNNAYTFNRANTAGTSWSAGNDIYQVVGDDDGDGVLEATEDDLDNIALVPKAVGDWAQPTSNAGAGRINQITDATGATPSDVYPAFLEKGIFNGREAMAVRITDIDLDLLRRNTVTGVNNLGGTNNTDWWLPLPEILDPGEAPTRTGAAIYAFREDAVREDAIARPRVVSPTRAAWGTAWLNYVNDTIDANYLMDAVSDAPQDPPANPINGISPKAVDFYADPDRRPHGFRLRNGADLRRIGANADDLRGMSFVSDNPVYVQGDFNLHSTNGTRGGLIQEFNELLANNWNNFFTRQNINPDFARAGDSWRASEVVGDGISLLSDNFVDGWVSQGILNNDGSGTRSSFRTLNRPNNWDLTWVREDGSVSLQGNLGNAVNYDVPIKISQRGFPVYCAEPALDDRDHATPANLPGLAVGASCAALGGEEREYGLRDTQRAYFQFNQGNRNNNTEKPQIDAPADTYMNMLMVSGTLPSRANQSNGGLHNFPRFLEDFDRQNMWIAGSIYQLAFSNSATGPFDQDSWEPGQLGVGPENIRYYAPPNRRWGYDTALQLVQPAPIAQRFASPSNIRSEFYRELPVDDPYIVSLRCAVDDPSTVPANLCP